MRCLKSYLAVVLILACVVAMVEDWGRVAPAEAGSPAHPLSRRPRGGNEDELPPEERGLVIPGQGGEDKAVRDPGKPGFTATFPKGSVSETIRVKFFEAGLPEDVPSIPNVVGSPFFFGAWGGEGKTVCPFNLSTLISVNYDDHDLSFAEEERLRVFMYNPAIKSWAKLGGRTDMYRNVITAIVVSPTPFAPGGNALFAVAVDEMPPLAQTVDEVGKTTLSVEGQSFRVQVSPGAVEVGTHFEVTPLVRASGSAPFEIVKAVDVKAYKADNQISRFAEPVDIEFDHDVEGLGWADLAVVTLRDGCRGGGWVDAEGLGYEVVRTEGRLTVETDRPGAFGLAIKQQ